MYISKYSHCNVAYVLIDNNIKFEVIEYLEIGINKEDIRNILRNGKLNILDIVRKNEEEYKLYIRDKNLSEEGIITLICKYPRLLQRPILFNNGEAIVARDEESLNKVKKW